MEKNESDLGSLQSTINYVTHTHLTLSNVIAAVFNNSFIYGNLYHFSLNSNVVMSQ